MRMRERRKREASIGNLLATQSKLIDELQEAIGIKKPVVYESPEAVETSACETKAKTNGNWGSTLKRIFGLGSGKQPN